MLAAPAFQVHAQQLAHQGEFGIALGMKEHEPAAGLALNLVQPLGRQPFAGGQGRCAVLGACPHLLARPQLLPQAPGPIGLLVLLQRVGVLHHPQEVVGMLGAVRLQIAFQRNGRARQRHVGRRQGAVHVGIARPDRLGRRQQQLEGRCILRVDQQPHQALAQRRGAGVQRQALLEGLHGLFRLRRALVVGAQYLEEGGLALQALDQGRVGQDAFDLAADLGPVLQVLQQVEGLRQMAHVMELLPGVQGHPGRLAPVGALQQAYHLVVVADAGVRRLQQAAVGLQRQCFLALVLGQVAQQAPVLALVLHAGGNARLRILQPAQTQGRLALQQREHGGGHGMGRRALFGIGKHTLPGLQRQLRPACAFGQLGQQDLRLRRAAVLLQIVDGLAGLGLALVGLDQRLLQRGILGTAAQLVAQAGNQGAVVEQARRQAHHRLPGILAPRVLRNDQPVVQGLLLLPHPFGHLGQAFAPGHVLRRLAHGGRGHAPGIFQVAVFEEYLVAQQVGLVVKGQARRRLAHGIGRAQHAPARRGPGHGLQRPGAVVGNRVRTGARSPGHLRLPLLQQRQLQQPLGIALGLGPVAGRARQADELS